VNFVDGGFNYNNPIRALIDEAKYVWGKSSGKIQCISSVGTGVLPLKAVGDSGKRIFESLVPIAMDTQKIAVEFADEMEHLAAQDEGLTYARLILDHGLQNRKLGEWKGFDVLTGATNRYLNTHEADIAKSACGM
jgi:hypothetical protein